MIDVLVTISLDDMLIGRLKEDDAFGNDPDENPPTEIPVSEEETSGTTGEKKRGRGRPRKS